MSSATPSRRTALLVSVVVCVALSGITVLPTTGSAAIGAGEPTGYIVSGTAMQISTETTFGLEKYSGALANGAPFSQTIEAGGSTAELTFTDWRIDEFDNMDYGVNLRQDATASVIADPNGDDFQFDSFTTETFCGGIISFDVVGYRDGSPVSGATETFTFDGSNPETVRQVGFASVDEIRFQNYQNGNKNQCLKLDNFVLDQAVSSNTQPSFSNLDSTIAYNEQSGTPVIIDSDATVTDTELDTAGDYAGSTLTVTRQDGANPDDSFGFDTSTGTFDASGSELSTGGATFGSYTQSGGTLTIDFTSAETTATPALVDDVLQGITYENTGDPVVVEYGLTLSFEDGDSGGSLTTSESQPVVFDPALEPISTSTTLDFTDLGPVLANSDEVDARNVRELLFYGFRFEDAAESSLVASNGLQLEQATPDPATTGTRFESDAPFALDALDIENFNTVAQDVTVYGYRDGTQVASQTYTMAANSGYQTKDPDGDDPEFQRVDEVRFTSSVSDQVSIDNVVVDQSNVAPSIDLDTDSAGSDSSVTFSELDDQGTASADGVAVAGPVSVSDADGTVSTVTVTLDNPQGDTDEGLDIDTSSLAADLGFSTSATEITITRNTATDAELTAAVEAVRFQNGDDAPDTTDRTVTVTATDDAGATASATATVAVQPGNDGPSIVGPDGTLQPTEDVAFDLSGANPIDVSDPDVGGALMSVSLATNHGTLTLGSTTGLAFDSGSNGASSFTVSGTETDINNALATLDYQGDTDYNGADTVTVTVSDNGNTGTDPGLTSDGSEEVDTTTVSLDVQSVADAPTISAIEDQTTDEDQPLTDVAFTVDDAETAAGSLTLSFSSDTPSLIESHSFGGTGSDRTLDITPAADQSGSTVITVTVSDGGLSASEDFLLIINAVNDRPTITPVDDVTVEEDSAVPSVGFTVDDIESGGAGVAVTATSSNQALVPDSNLAVIDNGGGDRTLDVSLAPDATGTATISLAADDGTDTRTEQFDITATPVNDPPSISDPADTTLDEDTAYSVTPTVTDPDTGDTTTFSITNRPDWASFDTSTGELSGTPTNADVGTYTGIEITVEDSGSATDTTEPFSIDVQNTNDVPTISDPGDQTADEDSSFSFTPTANDVDVGDSLTYSASGVPGWASFDTSTGEISGTPTNADVGTYTGIEITAEDGSGATDTTAPFSIEVQNTNDPPSISDPADTTLDEDIAYSVTPTVTDVDVGDTTTFSITNRPSWATFDTSTGELSGTPTNANVGTYSDIQITVEDSASATDTTEPFRVVVENVNDAPTIADPGDQTADEDSAFSVTPTATDVDAGDTLTYSESGVPEWASFDTSTGEISGTPTNADVGSYTGIEITVEDAASATDTTAPFSIEVQNTNDPPTITDPADATLDEDTAYSVTPTANDVDVGDTATFSITNRPSWASFDTSTGELSGTPTNANVGTYSDIQITVEDSASATDTTAAFSVEVTNINDPPTISDPADATVDEDSAYSVTPTVTDVDAGDTTTFSITNRPSWASFDTSTGELSGTPTNADVGSYSDIQITVEDSGSLTDTTASFSIDVQNVNDAPTITTVDDITVDEDAGVQTVTATVADVDTDVDQLTTGYSVDGGPLFDTGNVSIDRNGATVTLDVTLNADAVGTDTVTLTADDGALTTQERFDITTEAVNDAPSFTSGADQTVTNDTGQQTVAGFATGFAPGGGADESGQAVAGYVVTVVSDPNGTLDGVYVATDGTLTYTPNESAEGTAAVDVAVQDDGGTGNGGTDTSPTQRFNVTVDTRPPAVTGATTEQTNLTLATDEALSTADEHVPAGEDFTVTADGEPISVTNTTVAGRNLTLSLGSAVGGGETVTLDYTRGSAVPQDAGGNRLAGFTNQSVTNHVPLAVNDTYTIDEDRTLGVDAANGTLADDTDANDPETLSAVVSTNVSHGTLSLYANGSFEYEPSRDYNGNDSFTYEVTDAAGNTDTGRVNITVNPVSDSSGGGGSNTPDRPTVAVDAGDETTDGGTESNSTTVSVSNAQANQPVRIALTDAETDGDETAGSDDGRNIDVPSLEVTVTEETDFELSVTTTETPDGNGDGPTDGDGTGGTRNFTEETGAQPIGYVTVEHDVPDEQISGVNFTFRVRQTYLDTSAVDTDSVALYRDETTRWNRLSTTLVEETESRYIFQATSPGLSVFTIGALRPRFAVTETVLGSDSVEPGESVDVTATVSNRGTGNGTYTVELAGNGSVVATQSVDVPAGTNRTVALSPTFETAGTYTLTVDNESVGTVVVQAATDETTTATPETPPTADATAETTADATATTSGSGDGMGVVAALLALCIVALRHRRVA